MELPHTPFSRFIERWILRIGEAVSWVWLLLLGIIVLNVVMRYVFSEGRIEFEEIQWHLYSVGFLVGLSYAYSRDAHVRVDVLRERFSDQTRAWIELYGIVLLLLPFIALVIYAAVPFVLSSWASGEVSEAPGGLGYRYLIKATLVLGFLLLLCSTLARLSRVVSYLFGTGED
ncbi:MAG: TRAP transporter small permease subunit [Pseudomonadales bacterium]|nr:TRAP transporter small permease subunit [Pseudomonadales bacterium]